METTPELELGPVSPVVKKTLLAQVYCELRGMLMSGRLLPGQELKVRELARHFGTSVQPVREALLQLVAERVLEPAPGASARVPVLDEARLLDLRTVRLSVEGLAASLAAAHCTPQDVAALREIVEHETEADDAQRIEASVQRNREFHFHLYQLSGSALLPPIIEQLWLQIGPHIRHAAEVFDARHGKGSAFHMDILDALARRDAEGVRKALEHDIVRLFDVLLERDMLLRRGPTNNLEM